MGEFCLRKLCCCCCWKYEDRHDEKQEVKSYDNRLSDIEKSDIKFVTYTEKGHSDIPVNKFDIAPPEETADKDTEEKIIVVAIWDYDAQTEVELTFKQSTRFEVLNKADDDWWYVSSLDSKEVGYVPSNYVILEKGDEESDQWFFQGIERREAESLLLSNQQPTGTFLIRDSVSKPGNFSLSVLNNTNVHHYRITKVDNSRYSLKAGLEFPSLQELVEYYKQSSDGMVCKLHEPCARERPNTSTLAKDIWEIDRTTLHMVRKIGAGNFGDVWVALWNDKTEVAVKTMKEGAMSRDDFIAEASVMKTLRHKHLVQLLAICTDREPIYIVTEYMSRGSLLDYLQSADGAILKVINLIDMMAQVASGMSYLESMGYIHRDLAARNILVGHNNLCKVADFGLARLMEENEYYTAQEGAKLPFKWLALEALLYRKFTIKSDVWSFGILMTEIITKGRSPYPGMKKNDIVNEVERGYRMSKPGECPEPIYEMMKVCWNVNPDDRPSFQTMHQQLEVYCGSEYEESFWG